jgi:MFS family permease
MVVSAIPFLLPLLFQTVFNWSPIRSGALVLFIFVGNIAIKPATTAIYRRYGFRRTLLVASTTLAGTTVLFAGLMQSTPLPVIALIALVSGAARSLGLTGLSTLMVADVPTEQLPSANAMAATVQQLFSGLGVAAASVFLRASTLVIGNDDQRAAYAIAFLATGGLALIATAILRQLRPAAGAGLASRAQTPARS